MGALSAFARGVAGQGFIDLSRNMQRQSEIDQRERSVAEEKEKDRALRESLAVGGGSGSRRGGALVDPEQGAADNRQQAVFRLMQDQGMSQPEAEAAIAGSETGVNPLTRSTQVSESFDDGDRKRNVSRTQAEPDVERFKSLMSQIGKYRSEAPSRAKSNYDQLMKGEQTDFETGSGRAAQADPSRAGALAQGVAVAGAKPLFDDGGDNKYTGTTGALTRAKVATEGSKQNENNANASKFKVQADKIKTEADGDVKAKPAERLTTTLNAINGLIRTYDEKSLDERDITARRELQEQAKVIAAELRRRGMPGTDAAPAPAAAKPAIKALPPGAKQIGTSGGKPVYQTPDGKKFIQG